MTPLKSAPEIMCWLVIFVNLSNKVYKDSAPVELIAIIFLHATTWLLLSRLFFFYLHIQIMNIYILYSYMCINFLIIDQKECCKNNISWRKKGSAAVINDHQSDIAYQIVLLFMIFFHREITFIAISFLPSSSSSFTSQWKL